MIETQLLEKLESGLNQINDKYKFKIYQALGDYKDAYRVVNDVVYETYGIAKFLPTTLLPIPKVKMFRMLANIEFFVNIDTAFINENGNYQPVVDIVSILNQYASQNQAIPYFQIVGEDNYQILPMFTLPTNDSITMVTSDLGEGVPVILTVEFIVTANIVNANSYTLKIDGIDVNFEQMVLTKQRLANQYSYKGSGNTKGDIVQGTIGIDVTMPQLLDSPSDLIIKDIVEDKNDIPHTVELGYVTSTGTEIETYTMTFGTNQATVIKSSNVGLNFSLMEVPQNEVNNGK